MFQVEQITTEYKVLALQYHPDKNEGDKEAERKFQQLKVRSIYSFLVDLIGMSHREVKSLCFYTGLPCNYDQMYTLVSMIVSRFFFSRSTRKRFSATLSKEATTTSGGIAGSQLATSSGSV